MNHYDSKPPRLGLKILQTFFDEDDFYELSSDIKEEYYAIAGDKGVRKARAWYWRQVLKSLPALAKDKVNATLFFLKAKIIRHFIPLIKYKVTVNIFAISFVTAANISFFTVTCSKDITAPSPTLPTASDNTKNNSLQLSKLTFFSNVHGQFQIYSINDDGSGLKRLSKARYEDFDPSWSPDGNQIVFSSGQNYRDNRGYSNIFIMNKNGTRRKQLTFKECHNRSPAWSPDGNSILFESYRNGNSDIFIMNKDGSNVRQLTYSVSNDIYPSWSPDGSKILFLTERHYPNGIRTEVSDNWEIYIMNADGTHKTRLTHNNATDSFPIFSPDGSKILYSSNIDGTFNIYTMNIDGSDSKQMTFSQKASNIATSWSSDGNEIAFYSGVEGENHYSVHTINVDGTELRDLKHWSTVAPKPRWIPRR